MTQSADRKSAKEKPLTVVIPCFCSEACLKQTVEELFAAAGIVERQRLSVILINDGSPDRTFDVIRELCHRFRGRITGIDLAQNAGQAQAKMAAFPLIEDGITVFMDDDGQHDPKGIPALVQKIEDGADIVYAQFPETKEAFLRRAASRCMDILMRVFIKKPRRLRITSFFALSERALEEMKAYHCRHPFIGARLLQKGYRAAGVSLQHRVRKSGRSGYTPGRLIRRAAEMLFLFRISRKEGEPPPYVIREVIRFEDV